MHKAGHVVIWRDALLPASETFVRNHIAGLSDWTGTLVGAQRVESALCSPDDVVLYADRGLGRLRRAMFNRTGFSIRLTRELLRLRPDVIHAHFARDGMMVAPIARMLGIPLIVTLHGYDVTSLPNQAGWRGILYRARLRRLFASAAHVVAVSRHIETTAVQHGLPTWKSSVLYLGVDLPAEVAVPRVADEVTVLFVGRFTEKKGIADALIAIDSLPAAQRDRIEFRIVGAGPDAGMLKALAEPLGARVKFLGFLSASEVSRQLEESSFVLVPSKTASNNDTEGLPMVVLEAGAHGRAVVAYAHAGIPEAVIDGETGILVPEGNIAALSEAVGRLVDDEELARSLGMNARSRIEKEFEMRRSIMRLETLYDSVRATPRRVAYKTYRASPRGGEG